MTSRKKLTFYPENEKSLSHLEPNESAPRKHVTSEEARITEVIQTHEKINDHRNKKEIIIDDMFASSVAHEIMHLSLLLNVVKAMIGLKGREQSK